MKRKLIKESVKVQILLSKKMRNDIDTCAAEQGFDSLQHFTRVLYRNVIKNELKFNLLSPDNKIVGTHVTEEDIKNYRRNKMSIEYRDIRHKLDDYH